jgi:hypothetical protein
VRLSRKGRLREVCRKFSQSIYDRYGANGCLTEGFFFSRIRAVRRTIGGGTIAALLIATLYAPLFHVHTHAGEAGLIHAHFPELESAEDESVVHMEAFHSHAAARSLDLLTTTLSQPVQLVATVVTIGAVLPAIVASHGFAADAVPRAHGPPDSRLQIPRAPPA